MIYGKDKALEMARSLLPSTRRKGARDDKAEITRASRHNVNVELHRTAIDPEYYDDSSTDFEQDTNHQISYVVRDRRSGDKTAAFERWSEAITKDVDQDSRLTHVKSLVPGGIIGDHAISHLEWKKHFASRAKLQLDENIELNRKEKRIKSRYGKTQNKVKRMTRAEEIKALHKIVEDGRLHRELNQYVVTHSHYLMPSMSESTRVYNEDLQRWETRYKTVYLTYPAGTTKRVGQRKLLGMHDIEKFLDDVQKSSNQNERVYIKGKWYANPDYRGNAYSAVKTFLMAVHTNKKIPKKLDNLYYWY